LTKSIYNGLKLSDLKSVNGLKKVLANLNFEDIQLMSKIKLEMEKFNPGYFEQKIAPPNLKSFLIKYKWSEKIQLNIVPSKFWVYIQIKLK